MDALSACVECNVLGSVLVMTENTLPVDAVLAVAAGLSMVVTAVDDALLIAMVVELEGLPLVVVAIVAVVVVVATVVVEDVVVTTVVVEDTVVAAELFVAVGVVEAAMAVVT